MTEQFFIQMSGAPGSGKSTIATAIAPYASAVIIDHDITKSALLNAHIPASEAGRASYAVLAALAQHLLHQGCNVIFDSPCFYQELLERGQRLAAEVGATYKYVECIVKDLNELDRRLRTREHLPSQVAAVDDEVFRDWIANMKRPKHDYLLLDTTRSLEVCIEETMRYIKKGV